MLSMSLNSLVEHPVWKGICLYKILLPLIRAVLLSGFVQILESPGILLFRIPGPGKSWKRHRSWKILRSPVIVNSGSVIVSFGLSS